MPHKILLLTAALVLASCTKDKQEKQDDPVIPTVRAGVVQQVQPDVPERYSASIEPFAQVNLAFKSGGIIQHILQVRSADGRMRDVQSGDKVGRNAVLAQVRSADYKNHVDEAEAQRAQAQAQLAQAKAQLAEARASFSEADIEYRRASNLFQTASVVKPQYDEAKGRYDTGAASVAAAEAGVKAAEDGLQKAGAAVQDARLSLSDTTLRAPFAGWVSARNVERGSLVGNSTIGFSMLDSHLVKAVFAVPDTTLSMVRLGSRQPVMLDALQHAFTGTITSISPQADPHSRVFNVEATIENPREQIRPGMIGSLTLGGPRNLGPRLVVPLSAVVRAPADPKGFAVFRLIQRDGKSYASAQPIDIGETFGDSIEVKRGVRAGEKIVAVGGAQVHNGQEVSVLP
jgi:multidrug efflux system membrane fusion protein